MVDLIRLIRAWAYFIGRIGGDIQAILMGPSAIFTRFVIRKNVWRGMYKTMKRFK